MKLGTREQFLLFFLSVVSFVVWAEAADGNVFVEVSTPDAYVAVGVDPQDLVGILGRRGELQFLGPLVGFFYDEDEVPHLVLVEKSSPVLLSVILDTHATTLLLEQTPINFEVQPHDHVHPERHISWAVRDVAWDCGA